MTLSLAGCYHSQESPTSRQTSLLSVELGTSHQKNENGWMSDVSDDAAGMRMRMGASILSILCDVAVGHDVTLSIRTLKVGTYSTYLCT